MRSVIDAHVLSGAVEPREAAHGADEMAGQICKIVWDDGILASRQSAVMPFLLRRRRIKDQVGTIRRVVSQVLDGPKGLQQV